MTSAATAPSSIWGDCESEIQPGLTGGTLYRIVENQGQIATRDLVDGDLERLEVLEGLLEYTRPARILGTEHMHYLLATPWRYPPLRHGSRFGRRHEESVFYGGLSLNVTLTEAAYYRLVFLEDMTVRPAALSSQHTVFSARYRSENGLRLQHPPFSKHAATLTSPVSYAHTQSLGSSMRKHGVQLAEFSSARAADGLNVALFSPAALSSRKPLDVSRWLCSTDSDRVIYRSNATGQLLKFERSRFLHGGELPAPA